MRAFVTLLWEQWRQTWRGLLLISGALFAYWLILVIVEPLVFLVFSDNPRIALAAAYVPVAGAIGLLFIQESRSQIGFAYPRRMFWLPVHTYSLVGAQFLFKIAIISLMAFAAGWVCQTEIKVTFAILPQVVFFAGLTAALLGLVFLSCGYGSGTGAALLIPALAISFIGFQPVFEAVTTDFLSPMPYSATEFEQSNIPEEYWESYYVYPEFSASTWWGGGATLVWWLIVSYVAARHARSEVPGDRVGRWVRVLSNVAYLDRDKDAFASPEAAQRWFEWRRVVYLFPWISLAIGLVLVATSQSSLEDEENKFVVGFSLLVVAPAIVAVIMGYAMTRPDPSYMWFVGGKPLTTSTLSRIRLMVSLKAIVVAYVLAGIAYAVASYLLFNNPNPVNSLVTDIQLITSTYGSEGNQFVMLAGAIWIALALVWSLFWLGRSAGVIAWIAGMIAGAYFYLTGNRVFDIVDSHIVSPIWVAFGTSLTVLFACCAIGAYAWAIRKRLLSPILLPILMALFAATAGSLYLFREVMGVTPPLAAIAVWLLVPLLPFATVPATLAWQRHR